MLGQTRCKTRNESFIYMDIDRRTFLMRSLGTAILKWILPKEVQVKVVHLIWLKMKVICLHLCQVYCTFNL